MTEVYPEQAKPEKAVETSEEAPPAEQNDAWRRVQLARHPKRPHALDYINRIFTDFHELHGDRDGQLSVDLDHPYRLIIQPANNPIPTKPDGGLDWARVTAILVVEVADTHG